MCGWAETSSCCCTPSFPSCNALVRGAQACDEPLSSMAAARWLPHGAQASPHAAACCAKPGISSVLSPVQAAPAAPASRAPPSPCSSLRRCAGFLGCRAFPLSCGGWSIVKCQAATACLPVQARPAQGVSCLSIHIATADECWPRASRPLCRLVLHAHPAPVLTASPHPLCLQIGYFKRILRETETEGVKLISAPSPTEVVEAAAKQVS